MILPTGFRPKDVLPPSGSFEFMKFRIKLIRDFWFVEQFVPCPSEDDHLLLIDDSVDLSG